ncbi:MAG: cyclase family protein [Planctomycetes bacterium]|nr:cyclase family protein [Planctomycetota bacterium]
MAFKAIHDVLIREWDPIGVSDEPAAQDEYDSYIPRIYRLIVEGADDFALARHLEKIETDQMGLASHHDRNDRIAWRLREVLSPLIGESHAEIRKGMTTTIIDISHNITDGMATDPRLPAVRLHDVWKREESAKRYASGVSFQIALIELCQNTGTYIDCPWHRFEDKQGVWNFPLERLVNVPATIVDARNHIGGDGEIEFECVTAAIKGADVSQGRAVLICTGASKNWGTPQYADGNHPWISERCAQALVEAGATIYGIDALNADHFSDLRRPVHSTLLRANIPILENLCNLEQAVGRIDLRLISAPLKIVGFGSCPVRAYLSTH